MSETAPAVEEQVVGEISVEVSADFEVTEQAEQAAAHDDHPPFVFMDYLKGHNLPTVYWDPAHTGPFLIFNKAKYAAKKYDKLSSYSVFTEINASNDNFVWAEEFVKEKPEWYTGQLDAAPSAADLAKAMTLAESKPVIGTFPKALSWVNQQTMFGTVALILMSLLVCVWGRRKADQLKPVNKLQSMLEAVVLFVRDDICRPNIAHGADKWTAHFAAIFAAILGFNVIGLVPGSGTASGNIGVTAAFALMTLGAMLVYGMKAQGVVAFWKHLVPVHWSWNPLDMAIYLILLVIELMGLIIKPAALAIRLFANMFGGHTVLLAFLTLGYILQAQGTPAGLTGGMGIFGFLLGNAIYFLELLVAFLQAYVFTLLSAVFIGAAMNPEH